ncbi:hypothetical protein [Microbacterium sp. ABRD28]|uniref:hypothetical protein n=1 Tax=Microbacterium sp. ABRD28 TaxID=2268461 RepID=UPI000F54D052|nr:hypothetical protein [Microbacterium sp. ABRD28]AZC14447.1 hypothetical protein DT073_12685 [Microbacterium sp. ABRD28]
MRTAPHRRGAPWAAVAGATLILAAITLAISAVASGIMADTVASVMTTLVVTAPSIVVGALLLLRRPFLWVGAQLVAVGAVPLITTVWAIPLWLADTVWTIVPSAISWPFWLIAPLLLAFTFPDGRALSRWWRLALWAVPAVVAGCLAGILLSPSEWRYSGLEPPPLPGEAVTTAVSVVSMAGLLGVLVLAVISVLLRYRRGDDVERLQVRWLGLGFLILPIGMVLALVSAALLGEAAVIGSVFLAATALALPLAIWVAVTRHGLYEIARVVSRTVLYAIVTAMVVGIYAVVVTSVTWLLPGLPALGVALATLVAAAAALPALRLVQRRIDRRFDRAHYDADEVVGAFGERLRTGTDPLTTPDDLTRAVERTLQPTSIGIWTTGARR